MDSRNVTSLTGVTTEGPARRWPAPHAEDHRLLGTVPPLTLNNAQGNRQCADRSPGPTNRGYCGAEMRRSTPATLALGPLSPVGVLALALALPGCTGDDPNASDSASEGLTNITSASQGSSTSSSTTDSATTTTGESGASESGLTEATSATEPTSTTTDGTTTTSSTGDTTTTDDTTSTTVDPTTTGSGTTDGMVEPCQVEETEIDPIPSDVLFVLDKSGSMSMEKWDHDSNLQTPTITRWKSLHSVVEAVVTDFDDRLNFGAKLYPKIDAGSYINHGACEITPGIEVPVAADNADALLDGIPGPEFEVLGGTPSFQALSESYKYLNTLMTGLDAAVIFITDGEISCDNPPAAAIAAISNAWDNSQIPTYVVGIDVDAQTSSQLNSFALAGGKQLNQGQYKFYQATDQVELQAAMQSILDDTISCVLPVEPEPAYPELFEVWIDGAKVPQTGDCGEEDGWRWTQEHTEIELCGQSCLDLKHGDGIEAK